MEGLKTMSERIGKLEKSINRKTVSFEEGFEDIIINRVEKRQKQQQREKIISIKNHYLTGVLSNIENTSDNVVALIVYTIKWVENNINKLAGAVGVSVNSDFKHETAVNLIKDINDDYDDKFYDSSIIFLVSMIYPKVEVVKLERKKSTSKKKGIFSKPNV